MAQQMGMAQFFAMEAGEYLERLDAIVSPSTPPSNEEFVRLARALRGSALMANQQPIATAAASLEAVARALRESKIQWDPRTKQIAVRGVDDLKILVRSVGSWGAKEDAKARAITQELDQLAGVRASTRMAAISVADAGTRAFVAREGAALASALERAATTLSQNPAATDQVQGILKVMQPLRGLAGLGDMPPLPDMLDGIQRAVAEVSRRKDAAPIAAVVFRTGAQALARAAREATAGSPAPDTPELAAFVAELGKLVEGDKDVVAIDSLFYADNGPHIVERGNAPGGAGTPSNARVELVSHGDHLRQVADALDRAVSDAQRALRVQPLGGTLAALANAGFTAFAQAGREAMARGAAQRDPAGFSARLREAGTFLSSAAQVDARLLADQLDRLAAGLKQVGSGNTDVRVAVTPPLTSSPAPAPPPPPPAPRPSVQAPVPPTAPFRTPAAPTRPSPNAPGPAAPVAAGVDDGPGLIGSLLHFQRFVDAFAGRPAGSVSELLAGPPVLPAAGAKQPAAGGDPVPIDTLCFSGPAALARALSLRDQVRAALTKGGGGSEVTELLEEIFDLVRLGQNN